MIQLTVLVQSVLEVTFDDWFVVVKRKYIFLIIIYGLVISKRLSGHYKFEFTPERKDNFTSNAYELRMTANQQKSCGWF
jgi:hypothetical protein